MTLDDEQRLAALRAGAEVLGSTMRLPMSTAARFVLLDAVRQVEAELRSLPLLRPDDAEGWFLLGEGSRSVRVRLDKPHQRAAWLMLDGQPTQAHALVVGLSGDALRHRLRRFADWVERRTRCPRLATAIRAIEVSRSGAMTLPGAPRVVTR